MDPITQLFNTFDPAIPLAPGDARYVDCNEVRGSARLLKTLAGTIRKSSTDATCQLIGGQMGVGKTTELLRLQNDLLGKSPEYFVVYCEADRYLDMNDVQYTDVLLAMIQQLSRALKERGLSLETQRMSRVFREIEELLQEPAHVGARESGIESLAFDIKRDPQRRYLVRDYLRPQASAFLEEVNDTILRANNLLRKEGYSGLVFIVDNLDRIVRTPLPHSVTESTNVDALFVETAPV